MPPSIRPLPSHLSQWGHLTTGLGVSRVVAAVAVLADLDSAVFSSLPSSTARSWTIGVAAVLEGRGRLFVNACVLVTKKTHSVMNTVNRVNRNTIIGSYQYVRCILLFLYQGRLWNHR